MSRLLRGTFILTIATFFSKFIGMIYIVPFTYLVKLKGVALYTYAYNPYTILLSIATMGVPLAVSKFVSKYNALGDYNTGRRLLKTGLLLMTLTGFLAFIVLFTIAPFLSSRIVGGSGTQGNSQEDITFVIRMVSTALIIVPSMSLIRGYFQGFQSMGPTAVSQVIEQIIRIVFIIVGSFVVIKVFHGEITTAVGLATFAATIGAVGGLIVLLWYWKKRSPHLQKLYKENKVNSNISLAQMYKETITYAIPFVAVGIAIPLYKMVDQFTVVRALEQDGYKQSAAENVVAIVTQTAHQLVMIPVSLATAFALTLIPIITQAYVKDDYKALNKNISQTFQIVLFLTVPAAIGLSVLAYPAYGTLFSIKDMNHFGGQLLQWYSPTAILFALFTITAAILQGLNKQKFALLSMLLGVLFKMVFNEPFIHWFEGIGSLMATNGGYIVSVGLNLVVIKKYGNFSYKWVYRRTVLILLFSFIMAFIVWLVKIPLLAMFGGEYTKWSSIFTLIVGAGLGALVYFFLSYRSGLLGIIFGDRLAFLKKRKQQRG
ncbi:polysaccharide biosynthesis protein [Fictibacillus sp. Mic-4]|uniref:putative polysaccharide biosynthesis protein n=1 Tax=Fictibacillus sp. Mic-4 TaxID=3132826 RepID=UPI003CF9C8F7